MHYKHSVACAVGCIALVAGFGLVLSKPGASAPLAPAVSPLIYTPVTSDLMNAFIQPRHIKLWLAGQSGDWTFADYERHNIGGVFERIVAAVPSYKGLSNSSLVAAFVTPQLVALDGAVNARDRAAFVQAYGELTNGCNGCHRATGHPFVVITQPDAAGFADQTFNTEAEHRR